MQASKELAAVILGAGQGKRMKSPLPKVLHKVCHRPMIKWVMKAAEEAGAERLIVVTGFKADMVQPVVQECAECVLQKEQLGTGHAVMQSEPLLESYKGDILILYGDTPLLTSKTLRSLISYHRSEDASATVLTAFLSIPTGYGRIIRDKDGALLRIVEEKDATPEEKNISEINTGIICVDAQELFSALHRVTCDNAQGEYYLTDIIGILKSDGRPIRAFVTEISDEALGVNTLEELSKAEKLMAERLGL